MLSQPPAWFILLAFLAALGPLVVIHELGHYWVARWFGVRSESFSIGFGREIAGWTDRRGTRWKIGWLPLGGYVKFAGDADIGSARAAEAAEISAQDRAESFHHQPVWRRFLIVLAGPMANFLLAIAIFAAFFAILGIPRTPNVVGAVQPGGAAEAAGLQAGDRILSIAGQSTESFEDISRIVSLRPGERVTVVAERAGREQRFQPVLQVSEQRDDFGQEFRIGRLGILQSSLVRERLPVLEILPAAATYTVKITRSMVDGLWQIISGRRSTKDLGGPLKMAQIAGQQASLGLFEFLTIVALFSINLGFINLLPVPMLDGGHLVLYAIEAVQRRPVSERAQDWAFRGGLAALLALLVFTTVNDLGSFGLWEGVGRLIG